MNTALSYRRLYRPLILITVASFVSLDSASPASAMDLILNSGFENGFNNWQTLGDTSIQSDFQGIDTLGGNSQGLLTTGCPAEPFANGECFDTQDTSNFRQDDPRTDSSNYVFNYSGNDQGDANNNNAGDDNNLQNFLGLPANSLNIDRQGGTVGGTRTPKEGSAIKQEEITVTEDSIITFHWNYVTNDGQNPTFGNQDYSFVTIYEEGSDVGDREIQILGDSDGDISTPITNGSTTFEERNNGYQFFSSELLPPGTYVVGTGVLDVDGTGLTSALLLDNFEVVPFDFSSTAGLSLVAGVFGLSRLRRHLKKKP